MWWPLQQRDNNRVESRAGHGENSAGHGESSAGHGERFKLSEALWIDTEEISQDSD